MDYNIINFIRMSPRCGQHKLRYASRYSLHLATPSRILRLQAAYETFSRMPHSMSTNCQNIKNGYEIFQGSRYFCLAACPGLQDDEGFVSLRLTVPDDRHPEADVYESRNWADSYPSIPD